MSKIKSYPIIGTKSSILWDEETDAWTYLSGRPVIGDDPHAFYKVIPTMFRAVDIRATSIATMPWSLMRGEEEYETSEAYENKEGLVGSMYNMLYLIEAALVAAGEAYWKREKNPAGYAKLRHLIPTSMQLDEDKAKDGDIVWKRNENGKTKEYTPEDIIYFWGLDPFVEIGPPTAWPAKAALNACGVLGNMDEFTKSYFGRGAIKAMIFSMSGASRETAEEFENWWAKFITGIKNAFTTKVLNADKVTPVVVGEGIKELENVTLSQEKREEIAYAFGIPLSLLFSNTANFAEAKEQKRTWYEEKVIPEAKFVASILNEQLYEPMGLKLVFKPETLSIMQEDEKERSMALGYLSNAEVPLDIAMHILGFDMSEEHWARIEERAAKKEEQAEELTSNLIQGGNDNNIGGAAPEDPQDKPEPMGEKSLDDNHLKIGRELYMWRNKCEGAIKRGEKPSSVDFIPVLIPGDVFDRVTELLKTADNMDAVKHIFTHAMYEREESSSDVSELVEQFKEMTQAIIWKGYP